MAQLQLHDHYNYDSGGPVLETTRAPSANVRVASPAIRSTPAGVGVWARLKQIYIGSDTLGSMDVTYMLERTGGAGTVHARLRIYRGTTLLFSGTNNSTAAGPTNYIDAAIAIDLQVGDTVELWGYVLVGAAAVCTVFDLDLFWDMSITSIARWPVTVALAITGAGIDYVVNS
jgi:hypothetical protein